MTVLGLDTATRLTSVGLVRDGVIVGEETERSRLGHAAGLPALVERVLAEAGIGLGDVDALAVSLGPGSFTGLRVGLGFAKGIVFASGVALVGVSTLEALAACAPAEFRTVAAANDARRGETYVATFRRFAGRLERVCEDVVLSPEDAVKRIGASLRDGEGTIVVGDAAERYPEAFEALRQGGVELAPFDEVHPRGSVVALIGGHRLEYGAADRVDGLVPLYVQPSAVERSLRTASLTMEKGLS